MITYRTKLPSVVLDLRGRRRVERGGSGSKEQEWSHSHLLTVCSGSRCAAWIDLAPVWTTFKWRGNSRPGASTRMDPSACVHASGGRAGSTHGSERRVSACPVGGEGALAFDAAFQRYVGAAALRTPAAPAAPLAAACRRRCAAGHRRAAAAASSSAVRSDHADVATAPPLISALANRYGVIANLLTASFVVSTFNPCGSLATLQNANGRCRNAAWTCAEPRRLLPGRTSRAQMIAGTTASLASSRRVGSIPGLSCSHGRRAASQDASSI